MRRVLLDPFTLENPLEHPLFRPLSLVDLSYKPYILINSTLELVYAIVIIVLFLKG